MLRIQLIWLFVSLSLGGSLPVDAQTLESSRQQTISAGRSEEKAKSTSTGGDKTSYSREQLLRRSEEAKKYYKLGVKFGRANLFRQAAELFQRAIDLKPDYKEAYLGQGQAYFDLGRWEDSINTYRKVEALNPKDKEIVARLKAARGKLGHEPGAPLKPQEPDRAAPVGEQIKVGSSADTGANGTAPTLAKKTSLLEIYRVGPADVLEIRFGDAPADHPTLFTVTANGLLDYPALEQPLQVVGLTPEEIGRLLQEKVPRDSASQKPEVLVAVRDYSSHVVFVSGLVRESGPKILRREALPLYVVLADAQPLPEAEQVTIVSRNETKPLTIGLAEALSSDLLIRPGDVITVQTALKQYFYVGGEVKQPGEKLFRRGLTLTQAILSSGGLTEKGRKIELRREQGSGLLTTTTYKIKEINSGKLPDVTIQAGDRIIVVQ